MTTKEYRDLHLIARIGDRFVTVALIAAVFVFWTPIWLVWRMLSALRSGWDRIVAQRQL